MKLEITDINVYPYTAQSTSNLLGKGSVTFSGGLTLKYSIMNGRFGHFISWAGRTEYTDKNGNNKNYHAIYLDNADLMDKILNDSLNHLGVKPKEKVKRDTEGYAPEDLEF